MTTGHEMDGHIGWHWERPPRLVALILQAAAGFVRLGKASWIVLGQCGTESFNVGLVTVGRCYPPTFLYPSTKAEHLVNLRGYGN
jgi:hypothetical protein